MEILKLLSKKDLLTKGKLEVKQVDLGDGTCVYVKEMTGRDRSDFEQSLLLKKKSGNETTYEQNLTDFRAKLAAATLCDEEGNALLAFSDFAELSKCMSAKKLELIVDAAQELNKISDKEKEDLTKNSEADQADNSTSDFAGN